MLFDVVERIVDHSTVTAKISIGIGAINELLGRKLLQAAILNFGEPLNCSDCRKGPTRAA